MTFSGCARPAAGGPADVALRPRVVPGHGSLPERIIRPRWTCVAGRSRVSAVRVLWRRMAAAVPGPGCHTMSDINPYQAPRAGATPEPGEAIPLHRAILDAWGQLLRS